MTAKACALRNSSVIKSWAHQRVAFDDIVDFATEITACPVAFVHFIDSEKQWAMAAQRAERHQSARGQYL